MGALAARRSKLCAAASAAWLLLGGTDARAAPELFVDLSYQIDPALAGCPSQTEFQVIVARQLGYEPHRAGSTLGVTVRAWRAGRKIEGAIDWSGLAKERVGGQRFVSRNRDCSEMMATMGFAMAVQIQVMTRGEAVAQATEKSADTTPPSSADGPHPHSATESAADSDRTKQAGTKQAGTTQADAEVKIDDTQAGTKLTGAEVKTKATLELPPPAPLSSHWSAMAGLGPSVAVGLGPDPVAQGRLFASFQLGRAALEVGAEASLPSTTRQDYGGGFRHGLMLGTLAACGQQGSVSLCGLAKMGRIEVTGVGVDRPASHDGFLAQLGLRLAYSVALRDRIVLLGHFDALCPVTSWTVDLNHVAVWTMPRVAAVAGIDIAARFR